MRLFNSLKNNRFHYQNYLVLLFICLLSYWPLTFGIFSLKNDAIHYFLPYRFNISEAICNSEWPFWSPYINLGYPVYGDMQSGAWNPVVWIFSLIKRYDLTLFQYETLLYIFLGGIGMYKLTFKVVSHAKSSLLIAICYMLSGFMLNGQLINWLASAAFIPFVLLYYLQTFNSTSYINCIKTGIALFFLFTAGYPSFFILTGYLLFTIFIVKLIERFKNKNDSNISLNRLFVQHLLIILIFFGLSLPAIISFIDLLPYYQRGSGITYDQSVTNSFEIQHFLSLFFPSTIKASDLNSTTDVTFRNIYFGILPIILLIAIPPAIKKRNILLIALAFISILFCLGDATIFHKLCFKIIPLFNTFRHPSQTKLFFLIAILLLAAQSLKILLTSNSQYQYKILLRVTSITIISLFIILVYFLFNSDFIHLTLPKTGELKSTLKYLLENTSLADTITANCIIQLLFAILFLFWIKSYNRSNFFLASLWILNMVIMAQLLMPITFVSQYATPEINKIIKTSPAGFPTKNLEKPIEMNSKDALSDIDKIGISYYYNKKIGISKVLNSPSSLSEQEQFQLNEPIYKYVSALPVVYAANKVLKITDTDSINNIQYCKLAFTDTHIIITTNCNNSDTVFLNKLSSNSIEITSYSKSASVFVLTQNYHHSWKAKVDGVEQKIFKTNISFMGINLPAGSHNIQFSFVPQITLRAIWVMIITMVLIIITLILSKIIQNKKQTIIP